MAIKVTIDENFNNPKVKVLMLKGEKGEQGDLNSSHIVDNLTSIDNTKVLSAKQGKVLKDFIDNKPYYFDTVEDMKEANLRDGDCAITLGYYNINDGGGAEYKITDDESEVDYQEELDNGLYATLIINDYVMPTQFGAVGNGIADDTEIVRKALKYSIDNKKVLLIDKKFYIKNSLLTNSDYNQAIFVHIKGNSPVKEAYDVSNYGGIKFDSGINLFDSVHICGIIENVCFAPTSRTQTGSIFYNCNLETLLFKENYVCNILAFLHNTSIHSMTKICDSRFLSVYYFAKCDDTNYSCVDSQIYGNYINGGTEMNNNNCFEFLSWNGSSVFNNFIDYYRTIYEPFSPTSKSSDLPLSNNNQYQVFRYLYYRDTNISAITFNSNNDVFNWNKPSSLAKISSFTPHVYTGHDTNEHDVPPYILITEAVNNVTINNAYLETNLENIVFVRASLANYVQGKSKLTCNGNSAFIKTQYPVIHADSLYNNGTYRNNLIDIPFCKTLESLPSVSMGWTDYYLGERIIVNNIIYRLVYDYENTQSSWIKDYSL